MNDAIVLLVTFCIAMSIAFFVLSVAVYCFIYDELYVVVLQIAQKHEVKASRFLLHIATVLGIIIASIPVGYNLYRAFRMMERHYVKFHA